MSNIDEKLASIPTSPLLAERMTKKRPSCENDPKIVGCSDDTISRQAVIDLLKQMRKDGDMVPWEGKNVFARIRKLPPVQPKPGKWIERESDTEDKENGFETVIVCSRCGYPATTFYSENCESRTQIRTAFCPSCGADMRGGEE